MPRNNTGKACTQHCYRHNIVIGIYIKDNSVWCLVFLFEPTGRLSTKIPTRQRLVHGEANTFVPPPTPPIIGFLCTASPPRLYLSIPSAYPQNVRGGLLSDNWINSCGVLGIEGGRWAVNTDPECFCQGDPRGEFILTGSVQ